MTTMPIHAALVGLMLGACTEPPAPSPAEPAMGSESVGTASEAVETGVVDHDTTTPETEKESLPMTGFSFVREDLAGMPYPYGDDLDWVAEQGVQLVISLTESAVEEDAVVALGMELLHLPIEDFHAPSPVQQVDFVREIQARRDAGDVVAVHCLAGLGRTGTMLATWLVAEGLTAEEAIDEVRTLRPGSIETFEQEDAVRRFARAMEER